MVPQEDLINELEKEGGDIQRVVEKFPGPSDYLSAHVATNIMGHWEFHQTWLKGELTKKELIFLRYKQYTQGFSSYFLIS